MIGWYRNGAGLGLQLLPDDVETHLTYFDKPWQTTMLVMPDPAKPKGAFFTYDPRVSRSYCIPFYELFDSPAAEANRPGRTCVSWTTYVASAPLSPLPVAEKEVVESTVAPPRKPEPEPVPVEPIDEWWDAIKDPWVKLKDAAVSARRRDETPPVVSETVRPRPPLVRPLVVEPPRAPAAPARDARKPDEEERIAPPVVSAAPRPVRATTSAAPALAPRPAPPPPRERPQPSIARPMSVQSAAPRRRPAPPLAMPLAAPNGPSVALPPDFHEEAIRWKRRRRIGFAVATASFLGVIVLSTLNPRINRAGPPPSPAAMQPATATPLTVAISGGDPVDITLGAAVDSLSGALAYYRDIANDHRAGLVGCRVLDRAYALVERARTRVDSTRQKIAGGLPDADSIRVAMLGAEYTFVTQTYRRSGCRTG